MVIVDFFNYLFYTGIKVRGVDSMNEFEKNVQSKTNDVSDSIVGVTVSFGFFATMFIIAVVIQLIGG